MHHQLRKVAYSHYDFERIARSLWKSVEEALI